MADIIKEDLWPNPLKFFNNVSVSFLTSIQFNFISLYFVLNFSLQESEDEFELEDEDEDEVIMFVFILFYLYLGKVLCFVILMILSFSIEVFFFPWYNQHCFAAPGHMFNQSY